MALIISFDFRPSFWKAFNGTDMYLTMSLTGTSPTKEPITEALANLLDCLKLYPAVAHCSTALANSGAVLPTSDASLKMFFFHLFTALWLSGTTLVTLVMALSNSFTCAIAAAAPYTPVCSMSQTFAVGVTPPFRIPPRLLLRAASA